MKIEKTGKIFFWVGIVTELIIVMVDKSAYTNPWEGQLFRLTFVLFAVKILTTRYSAREWVCIIITGLIAVCSYFVNSKDEVIRAAVFIIACKDIDLKKMIKVAFGITLCGSIVLFALSAAGIFGTVKITANFGRGVYPGIIETRYCFGMGHPNAFHTMFLMLLSLGLYIWMNQLKLHYFVLLEIMNCIVFYYTDSKTGFLSVSLLLIGAALLKYCTFLRESRFVYIAGAIILIGLVCFSAFGSHVGGTTGPVMIRLDAFLNGRFKSAHAIEAARVENWKLFGDAANEEYFDAGFVRLFYWYGIVPGVSYILMNLYLIYQSHKNRDYTLLVIVLSFAVFSVIEAHLISVYLLRNYLLVMMGYYWYQPFKKQQEYEGYLWQTKEIINAKNR